MKRLRQLWTPRARHGALLFDNPRRARRSYGTLKNGLLAYWALEEASGNRADASGNGKTLTPTNAPANMAGKVGNGANFVQGSSQSLDLASVTGLLPTGTGWWVGGWARVAAAQSGNPMFFAISPSSGAATLNRTLWIFFAIATGGFRVGAYAADGTTLANITHSLTGLALDAWHRFDFWHDPAASQLKTRVNGTTDTLAWPSNNLFAGTSQVLSMGRQAPNNSFFLTGGMDEVGIWNRPPTTAELAAVLAGNTYPF